MTDIEKQGKFYLGKTLQKGKKREEILLVDSKDFTTHALCIGMTGSGKTGLGIALLEEVALDKIPAIIIDPKGDMGNLFLAFPHLSSEEFLPWVDQEEAATEGIKPEELAAKTAKEWSTGLKEWGEDQARVEKLLSSVERTIYTPASDAGVPLSILNSFAAPPKEVRKDSALLRERILSVTSSLLGLLGINADPIKSREHILISTLMSFAWERGEDLDLAELISQVQNPPFHQIGALDIDSFFPEKERKALSVKLNNLLASPGFQAWMEGEPLDIQQLLYSKEGKPRHAIISIAHLSDEERMFFVTLLLSQFVTWMRAQSGSSSLRALLYMDEIFGFFPPTATPPSKLPMMTLLKQARGYGVGIVLVTQNPVDLDYKGLSNCGTWFIGKLQTERDKSRVLEGLKVASNGEIEAKELDALLSSTGKRKFILQSIHEKKPFLFETRWTLSYLCGPMTLSQIRQLQQSKPSLKLGVRKKKESRAASKPTLPRGFSEYYVHPGKTQSADYTPLVFGKAKLHFVDGKIGVDTWKEVKLVAAFENGDENVAWENSEMVSTLPWVEAPLPKSSFGSLPSGISLEALSKGFEKFLYQTETYLVYKSGKSISQTGESEAQFRSRLASEGFSTAAEDKVREKYQKKIEALKEKQRRLQGKLARAKERASSQKTDTLLSFGGTLLGALFGKKITKGTITGVGSSIKKAGKIVSGSQEEERVLQDVQECSLELQRVQTEMEEELGKRAGREIPITTLTLRPKKTDISVEQIALVWTASN